MSAGTGGTLAIILSKNKLAGVVEKFLTKAQREDLSRFKPERVIFCEHANHNRIFVHDEQLHKIKSDISFTPRAMPPFMNDYMTRPLQKGRICAYCNGEHFEDNMCFDCGADISSASVFVGLRRPDQEVYLIR